jgi:hypothetical protein
MVGLWMNWKGLESGLGIIEVLSRPSPEYVTSDTAASTFSAMYEHLNIHAM